MSWDLNDRRHLENPQAPHRSVVVGDGPQRAELQRSFPEAIWRGYRFGADLAAHYAGADCFVFPSRTETFGNVLLEAMASGLPVAAVPSPGPSDLITDGVNGALGPKLQESCLRALGCSRAEARGHALRYGWPQSHQIFASHLTPLVPSGTVAYFGPPSHGPSSRKKVTVTGARVTLYPTDHSLLPPALGEPGSNPTLK